MGINHVGIPQDLTLPFFAYGIFKPGQLAYPQIERYVKGEPSAETTKHEMLYRDGIALLVGGENEIFETSGYLIRFADPQRAYNRIGKFEPEELYEWKQIDVGGECANALVGVDEECGSFDNQDYVLSTYDYRQDSFFNDALDLIKDTVNEFENKKIKDMKDFFKLQMHYMLLWSIIERFCNFSYGYFPIGSNMFNFAKERSFKDELRTITRNDVIYSSDTLDDRYLDPFSYRESIKYYYTIRCNVVHKGKTVKDEERNKLKVSLGELYRLFMAVYDDKLMQNDELFGRYGERWL